ncbi:peptidase S8/S53 domain-containing protein [Chytridium lagenaria]|nr:peptidase S8/S53 domain-containing protein [Chytridium lagenaria]
MLIKSILAAVACGLALTTSAAPLLGPKEDRIDNAFLFEVDQAVENPQEFVIAELDKVGVPAADVKIRLVIKTDLFTGVSVQLPTADSADEIVQTIPGAKQVFRINSRPFMKPLITNTTNLPFESFHSLTGVNDVRKQYNLSGKGIKVAIIDSGVFYSHPALGGGFGSGFKVGYGYDLVGDAYGVESPIPSRTLTPLTTARRQGTISLPLFSHSRCFHPSTHGTHVAGIVGAEAINMPAGANRPATDFTGVAPGVTLGAYRVFGCPEDSTATDVIAAAIYMAARDGSDVINLSLGGGPVYADGADSYAAEVVGKAGHLVVAANGNSQASGLMTAGSPGVSRGGFGIASFDNAAVAQPAISVEGQIFPYFPAQANARHQRRRPKHPRRRRHRSLRVNATGKALLIRWGNGGGSAVRCRNAFAAGAAACIIYSNTESIIGIAGFASLPGLSTTNAAGKLFLAALKAGRVPRFTIGSRASDFPLPTAGTVSDFSSPGLDPELFIKPDLGGIGGQVLSTISTSAAAGSGSATNYAVATVPYAGMVGRWRDAPIWAKKSDAYGAGFLQQYLAVPYANLTSLTGAYSITPAGRILPVSSTSVVNSTTDGLYVLPIAATTSRYAKVEVVFAGTPEEKRTLPGAIRHKTPLGYGLVYAGTSFLPAVFTEFPRHSPQAGPNASPSFYFWAGEIVTNATTVDEGTYFNLPPGSYQLKFSGLKHWGRVGAKGDSNYDVVTTPTFRIVK